MKLSKLLYNKAICKVHILIYHLNSSDSYKLYNKSFVSFEYDYFSNFTGPAIVTPER